MKFNYKEELCLSWNGSVLHPEHIDDDEIKRRQFCDATSYVS